MLTTTKLGRDLRVGDVVDVWFNHTATVLALRPYTGTLAHLFDGPAMIGTFSGGRGKVEMTIDPSDWFDLASAEG